MRDNNELMDFIAYHGAADLFVRFELEWSADLETGKPTATIIGFTKRKLEMDGGNGMSGFDGRDFSRAIDAVTAWVDSRMAFNATRFIVRSI